MVKNDFLLSIHDIRFSSYSSAKIKSHIIPILKIRIILYISADSYTKFAVSFIKNKNIKLIFQEFARSTLMSSHLCQYFHSRPYKYLETHSRAFHRSNHSIHSLYPMLV